MNIMAQAHKDTRSYMAQQAIMQVAQKSYKVVFAAMLVNCHYHYKAEAMKKEQALMLLKADTTAKWEARIAELKAYAETPAANKWLVTCGGLPVNFESVKWPWAQVEGASQWNSPQFARANAEKIRNGAGEYGVAVNVAEYCETEIAKLTDLINAIV